MAAVLKPAGPKGRFRIGRLLEFNRDPLNFLLRCKREYGDIVYFNPLGMQVYLLNHPDLIESVLINNYRNCIKDRGLRIRSARQIFGNGLLTSEGDFWIRQRRLAQPAFHRERIAAYGEEMVSCTERMIDRWRPGETIDVHQYMMQLTLEIVVKTLFGDDTPVEAHDVDGALEAITDYFSSQTVYLLPLSFLPTPGRIRLDRAISRRAPGGGRRPAPGALPPRPAPYGRGARRARRDLPGTRPGCPERSGRIRGGGGAGRSSIRSWILEGRAPAKCGPGDLGRWPAHGPDRR